ncbi:MAG: 3-methyl-2-oxobutanoate hydroxymethyltransferase [Microbacterium sp.]
MSTHAPRGERIGIADLARMKANGERIVMVTAYDYPSAGIADAAGVDVVLVGDSGAMTVLGYDSTVPVTVDEMLVLCRAARRGAHRPLLVGDLPFGSYEASDADAVATAQRFVKEAGCDAVKLEGGGPSVDRARAIVRAGIPVMGHVGLTPQTAASDGGVRARGRTAEAAVAVLVAARALEAAGCFSIVFEAMPAAAAAAIAPRLRVPVIGIGAGADVDGQVLVFHDLLGIHDGAPARFVKRYDELRDRMITGVASFADDVRSSGYPAPEHTYGMPAEEQTRLEEFLAAP